MTRSGRAWSQTIIRLAAVLLVLALLSSQLLSGMLARYTVGDSAEDSARVARFTINLSSRTISQEFSFTIDPQQTTPNRYVLEIENAAEVAVRATIQLEMRGNLPLAVSVFSPVGSPSATCSVDNTLTQQDSKTLLTTLSWEYDLELGETRSDRVLVGWTTDETYTSYRYENGIEYTKVTVTVVQLD